jgi:hypothetical protein
VFGKANVHLTFAVGECPVGESHIGELPATRVDPIPQGPINMFKRKKKCKTLYDSKVSLQFLLIIKLQKLNSNDQSDSNAHSLTILMQIIGFFSSWNKLKISELHNSVAYLKCGKMLVIFRILVINLSRPFVMENIIIFAFRIELSEVYRADTLFLR